MKKDRSRWIITSYKFHEHHTAEAAQTEIARLRTAFPDKRFRLYRIKYPLKADATDPTIAPSDVLTFAVDPIEESVS